MRYLFLILFFVACAPVKHEPFEPNPIELEESDHYSIETVLENLPKPEKPKVAYIKELRGVYVPCSKEEATHVLLSPDEYAKFGILVKRTVALKDIALEQEHLVNTYIDQLNNVKKLFMIEQDKAKTYRELWIDSENSYRNEKHIHTWDNRINRTGIYLITIGSIIALALAL